MGDNGYSEELYDLGLELDKASLPPSQLPCSRWCSRKTS